MVFKTKKTKHQSHMFKKQDTKFSKYTVRYSKLKNQIMKKISMFLKSRDNES